MTTREEIIAAIETAVITSLRDEPLAWQFGYPADETGTVRKEQIWASRDGFIVQAGHFKGQCVAGFHQKNENQADRVMAFQNAKQWADLWECLKRGRLLSRFSGVSFLRTACEAMTRPTPDVEPHAVRAMDLTASLDLLRQEDRR